jgi:23S rRNA (guanosine2251-2'-O)-methyltransferase
MIDRAGQPYRAKSENCHHEPACQLELSFVLFHSDIPMSTSRLYHSATKEKQPILVAHNVRSILNVGALFRTADALGFGIVYLLGYTPGPDTHPEKLEKTALGAQESVEWHRWEGELAELAAELRGRGYAVVALEQHETARDVGEVRMNSPFALVVGNEVEGLEIESHNVFDAVVHIPMRGEKESLNVAIAFGIAGYQLLHGKTAE